MKQTFVDHPDVPKVREKVVSAALDDERMIKERIYHVIYASIT